MAFREIEQENYNSARHHLAAAKDRVADLKDFDEKDVVSRALAQNVIRMVSMIHQNLIDNLVASGPEEKKCDYCGQDLPKNAVALAYHVESHFDKPLTPAEIRQKNADYINKHSVMRSKHLKKYRKTTMSQKEKTPTAAAVNPIELQTDSKNQESDDEHSEMEWTQKDEDQQPYYDSDNNAHY